MAPRVKDRVLEQGADVVEKAVAGLDGGAQHLKGLGQQVLAGVCEEGQGIECEQHVREVLLAMAEVVLKVIARFLSTLLFSFSIFQRALPATAK